MRKVIADAFLNKTLWTTDWRGVQLQRCVCDCQVSQYGQLTPWIPRACYQSHLPTLTPSITSSVSCKCGINSPFALRLTRVPRNDTHITPNAHKKAKKSSVNKSAGHSFDPNDLAALNRRAARFQREHELERQKGPHGQTGHAYSPYSHIFANRSGTPALDGDAPEMNSVRLYRCFSTSSLTARGMSAASELGQIHDCRHLTRDLQGLSPLDFSECAY